MERTLMMNPIQKPKIIAIDPGDHIGIVYTEGDLIMGTTLVGDERNLAMWELLEKVKPEIVIYETFALRANMANKLTGSKFVTCEVIGVIKLWCQLYKVKIVPQLPITKEYCGFSREPKDPKYKDITMLPNNRITEHTRDAYRLYTYYKLFGKRFK